MTSTPGTEITAEAEVVPIAADRPEVAPPAPRSHGRARFVHAVSPTRWSGIYVLVTLSVVFSFWKPGTFPKVDTIWQVLNSNSVSALAALTLVVPLATGVFDISVPYTMSLSGAVAAYALVNSHYPIWVAILLALGASACVGAINVVLIVHYQIESLIATLASGFIVQSLTIWRTDNQIISGTQLTGTFHNIAFYQPFGQLTLPVVYVVVTAIALGLLLRRTPTGRRIYAVGFNREAARLAGIHTDRIRAGALMASSLLAGMTGVVLTANVGSASTSNGATFLLPAFAGVFLGATQIRPGRFNPWGTVLAMVLLGTLTTGFGIANVDQWIQQLASGLILILALVIAGREVRNLGRIRRRRPAAATPDPTGTLAPSLPAA